ncbi:MAG: hypothetical protein QNJ18_03340 [Xenococcaceae cyanobacterium MO_167.B52]|nr:hypothetical protein [Xenococcaceae cyanobacterium MO_167.B52]
MNSKHQISFRLPQALYLSLQDYIGFAEKVFWRGSEVRSQKSEVRRGNQNNLDNLKVYGF